MLIFVTAGSIIGGYAPAIFGNNDIFVSLVTGTIGGIIGIWVCWKFINYIEG